ncbi:putative Protein asunder-like protein [Hypsibius exemplaris]|uniref:Protein asunder n=1 Tax=Hypsibius exemplaris TaxID=2072580 RepID=A0A1W0WTR3_HYPEX|nr:putative Protein asunder-like protein [Hypsibius exemplaris]
MAGTPITNAFRTIILIENSATLWAHGPDPLEIDTPQKGRSGPNTELLPSVRWTWLTWAAEACFEYCRIGWDVHPDYQVSIFGCDENPEPIEVCPLEHEDRQPAARGPPPSHLRDLRLRMTRLMHLTKQPAGSTDQSLNRVFRRIRGLESEALLTVPMYYNNLDAVSADQPFYLRLILVTTSHDKQEMYTRIRTAVKDNNIGYLARYEVAVIAVGCSVVFAPVYEKIDQHEEIYVTWYGAATGNQLVDAFKTCLTWDLRLSRTIVSDIPMREDVKSGGSTSVSYNVELFHPCLVGESGQGRPGGEALRMKWMRPVKGAVPALVQVPNTQLVRASPSDPITRPTQCLVGYVLEGNAVLLESDRAGTTCKLFLCRGKISLQQLKTGTDRVIDDIPALSDLPGGRVSSYRAKEMVMLLSVNTLDLKSFPLQKTLFEKQAKLTSYFPIVYTDTIVYLLPQFMPLLEAITTVNPKDANWDAARQAIDEVLEMEKHNQTLPGIASHALLQSFASSQRKMESYAVTWAELDLLLESCSQRSLEHAQLRDYLCRVKRHIREDLKSLIKSRLKSRMYNGSVPAVSAKLLPSDVCSKKRKARPEFEGRLKWGRFGKIYQNLPKLDKNQRDDALIHASIEL